MTPGSETVDAQGLACGRKVSVMADGRRVMVTAAAGGIGRAFATAFAAHGDRVYICDIDQNVLQDVTDGHAGVTATVS